MWEMHKINYNAILEKELKILISGAKWGSRTNPSWIQGTNDYISCNL